MKTVPLTDNLGADLVDVDLSRVDDALFEEIYRRWVEYGVLRIRNQVLDDRQLEIFSARFGPLEEVPVKLTEEERQQIPSLYVTVISNIRVDGRRIGGLFNKEAAWHSDMTYKEDPPPTSVLFAHEIPKEGGNTQFACQYASLESMPEELVARIAERQIKHDASHTSVGELRRGYDEIADVRQIPGAVHPIIKTHEETGRPALFLGRRDYAYVMGMEVEESEQLLNEIWSYAAFRDNIWTQQWQVGDVVIWDNRRVLHRRDAFAENSRRLMKRCQVLAH